MTVGLVVATAYVSHVDRFLIAEVRVEGNNITKDKDIENIAHELLEGKYMWLYPRANMVMYPSDQIKEAILREIPRLQEVELSLVDQRVLEVTVEERTPHALYCENISSITDPVGCYFLEGEGFIFSHAPSFSGDVYFLYSVREPLEEPLGKSLLPAEEFVQVAQFIDSLREFNIHPRALEIVPSAEEFQLILPGSGKIIWKSTEDIDTVARNFEAFILDEGVAGQADFFDRVLYVDLRFENKVFYKFQDSGSEEL